jgi:hypothetical protein
MSGDMNQPISSAPRTGLSIIVGAHGAGEYLMHWNAMGENPLVQRGLGIWESLDRGFTWSEESLLGPTYWRPYEDGSSVVLAQAEEIH